MRLGELGLGRRTSQPARTFSSSSGESADGRIRRIVHTYPMIFGVGDQNAAVAVDAQVLGTIEPGLATVAAVAGVARLAGADDGFE